MTDAEEAAAFWEALHASAIAARLAIFEAAAQERRHTLHILQCTIMYFSVVPRSGAARSGRAAV